MNQEINVLNPNSSAWLFFVKACFCAAVAAMAIACTFLPVPIWVKGYVGMGSLLLVASSMMLAKTMRDEFEAQKITHRLDAARAEQILKEID